jgi:serine/threonine protein phosphatase PrpC
MSGNGVNGNRRHQRRPVHWRANWPRCSSFFFGIASDIGPRQRLEDAALAAVLYGSGSLGSASAMLLGVFDGVGGVRGGMEASRCAARVSSAYLSAWFAEQLGQTPGREEAGRVICEAIRRASVAVRDLGIRNPSVEGAATTAVIAVLFADAVLIGNVGDSRAYQVLKGDIERLTADHTTAQSAPANDTIDQAAAVPEERQLLVRWLGSPKPPEAALAARRLAPGSTIVLVSDGVHAVLSDSLIASIVTRARSAQLAAHRLVEESLRRGTTDNATAVCCRVVHLHDVAINARSASTASPSPIEEKSHGSSPDR